MPLTFGPDYYELDYDMPPANGGWSDQGGGSYIAIWGTYSFVETGYVDVKPKSGSTWQEGFRPSELTIYNDYTFLYIFGTAYLYDASDRVIGSIAPIGGDPVVISLNFYGGPGDPTADFAYMRIPVQYGAPLKLLSFSWDIFPSESCTPFCTNLVGQREIEP